MSNNYWFRITHEYTDAEGRDCEVSGIYQDTNTAEEALKEFIDNEIAGGIPEGRIVIDIYKETP